MKNKNLKLDTFQDCLNWMIKQEGLSQQEAASKIGISRGHINRLLSDLNVLPTPNVFLAIIRAFQSELPMSVSQLMAKAGFKIEDRDFCMKKIAEYRRTLSPREQADMLMDDIRIGLLEDDTYRLMPNITTLNLYLTLSACVTASFSTDGYYKPVTITEEMKTANEPALSEIQGEKAFLGSACISHLETEERNVITVPMAFMYAETSGGNILLMNISSDPEVIRAIFGPDVNAEISVKDFNSVSKTTASSVTVDKVQLTGLYPGIILDIPNARPEMLTHGFTVYSDDLDMNLSDDTRELFMAAYRSCVNESNTTQDYSKPVSLVDETLGWKSVVAEALEAAVTSDKRFMDMYAKNSEAFNKLGLKRNPIPDSALFLNETLAHKGIKSVAAAGLTDTLTEDEKGLLFDIINSVAESFGLKAVHHAVCSYTVPFGGEPGDVFSACQVLDDEAFS